MKKIGEMAVIIGIVYGFHKLIGTEPNINAWWLQIGLGLIVIWIGETTELKAKQKRQAKVAREMQDLIDRHEAWRKERGL